MQNTDLAFNGWDAVYNESAVEGAYALSVWHTSGRVEISIEPIAQGDEVEFPVNIYESTNYDYGNEEYIDHGHVATVRPGTSGTRTPKSFRAALTLTINAILEMEESGNWLSEPLDTDTREFVNPQMTREEALDRFKALFGPDEIRTIDPSDALDAAETDGDSELAEFLYSLSEDDFWWFVEDVYQAEA